VTPTSRLEREVGFLSWTFGSPSLRTWRDAPKSPLQVEPLLSDSIGQVRKPARRTSGGDAWKKYGLSRCRHDSANRTMFGWRSSRVGEAVRPGLGRSRTSRRRMSCCSLAGSPSFKRTGKVATEVDAGTVRRTGRNESTEGPARKSGALVRCLTAAPHGDATGTGPSGGVLFEALCSPGCMRSSS
jgi:hypothetical protein